MRRIALIVMVLVAGRVAIAQPAEPPGTQLFNKGRELAKAGKWPEACEAFQQSLAIDRAPGTSLNYGDCLEHLGKLRKAWQMYDEAAREFDRQADVRTKYARERADAVIPKLGTVTVKIADPSYPGLIVTIGNESVPPLKEIVDHFEPGTIEVTAKAPGQDPFSSSARMAAGTNVIVEIPAFDGGTPPPKDGRRRNPARVKLALGIGAAGGVAVIAGSIFGLSARSKYNGAIDDMLCSKASGNLQCTAEGKTVVDAAAFRANVATGLFIGGGVLAAAAVVLFVTAPRESLTLTPVASESSVGLAVGRSF